MRRLNVFYLEPGMKLGRDIYNAQGEVLLNAGVTLTASYIKKLMAMGMYFVYVDDGVLPDLAEDIITQETRMTAVEQVKSIMLTTREKGQLLIEPQSLYQTVKSILNQLLAKENLIYNLIDLRTQDSYTFEHSVNVLVMALITGLTLNYDEENLLTLGVGALLHDLGKTKVPESILNKPAKLTNDEFELMKKHTTYGYDIIRSNQELGIIPAIIAYQHHENYDGSGYPLGVAGDDFHEMAQITALADRFDAITANRSYHRSYPPHEAYEMCAGAGDYLFKAYIVKAFLHNISTYPAGTIVVLNNGMVAVAVDTPKGYSSFPRVRVLFDKELQPVANPFEICLWERTDVRIAKVLND